MDIQLPRGMRDFSPEEKMARDTVVETLTRIFHRYGFAPLETPLVERFDVLSAKYAGGAEILKETFHFADQGGRELGLRYDLTVPLARFVAMNPTVKLPFKRYAIDKVFRDGPIKLGRYREFIQCDCDIVGGNSALADAQCIQLGLAGFAALGLEVRMYCNDVSLLKAMLRAEHVQESQLVPCMLILDKRKKIGDDGVKKELEEAGIDPHAVEKILAVAGEQTNEQKLAAITTAFGELAEAQRVREVLSLVDDTRLVFDPALSRGLAYYTGMVFETFTEKLGVSLSGGGRYDEMIGGFLDRPGEFPAVGISFGLEPIMEALGTQDARKTPTQVFIIPIKTAQASSAFAQRLRAEGINTDMDLVGRNISKNLEYANVMGIPYAVIVGAKELEDGKVKLKDMRSGEETLLDLEHAPKAVKELLDGSA